MTERVLKLASLQAGLNPTEKDRVDTLSKALTVHKSLLDMPAEEARPKIQTLPADQHESLKDTYATQ